MNLETDFPYDRFRAGEALFTRRGGALEQLTLTAVRFQAGRPIIGWMGPRDVNDVLPYVGAELRVPRAWLSALPEDVFYRHDLVGCRVELMDGQPVGIVRDVQGPLEGSCLVVASAHGEVLVPLAAEICTRIDVVGRTIVIDPPAGLLDLNAPSAGRPTRP